MKMPESMPQGHLESCSSYNYGRFAVSNGLSHGAKAFSSSRPQAEILW